MNEMMMEYIIGALVLLKMASDLPFIKSRSINDKNILETFRVAKTSIQDSNNIKFNVLAAVEKFDDKINRIEVNVNESIQEVKESVLAFQEDELYQKMLSGLGQMDEFYQTLQNKDSTIEMLGRELKETHLVLLEIKNYMKAGD